MSGNGRAAELFAKIISNSKLSELKENIMKDLDLVAFCEARYVSYCNMARMMLKLDKSAAREIALVTSIDVLNIMRITRPDLYNEIVSTSRGMQWFEKQVVGFKRRFL